MVVETRLDGEMRQFSAEELFVATDVQPNSERIGVERVGVDTDERGAVVVDEHLQTTNPEISAAGDVIGTPELETVGTIELDYMDEHGTCACQTDQMEDQAKARAVKYTRRLLQVLKHACQAFRRDTSVLSCCIK